MKKYNHGTTILEVLISIILISIIIGLLFTLLVAIQEDDEENNLNSSFSLASSTIIKAVEEDSINYNIKRVSSCTLQDAGIDSNTVASSKYECIRLEYDKNNTKDNIGYITIYEYYKTYDSRYCPNGENACNPTWVIRYTRGSYKDCISGDIASNYIYRPVKTTMREYLSGVNIGDVKVSYNTDYNSSLSYSNQLLNPVLITMPVSTYNGRHYDINIAFNHKIYSNTSNNKNFICVNDNLNCLCFGDNCNLTTPDVSMKDENNKYKFTC